MQDTTAFAQSPCFFPRRAPVALSSGRQHKKQHTKTIPEPRIPTCQPALTKRQDPVSPGRLPTLAAILMGATGTRPHAPKQAACAGQELRKDALSPCMCLSFPICPAAPMHLALSYLAHPFSFNCELLWGQAPHRQHLEHRSLPSACKQTSAPHRQNLEEFSPGH